MFLDMIHGTIERRILLNYRFDPAVLQRILPGRFRPKLYDGYGIGGICMIRFRALRPRHVPSWLGIGSENAAHRIAVEWDEEGETREGVFIPRRDTSSGFNKAFGGRVFPGIFNRSRFESHDAADSFQLQIVRPDGSEQVRFSGSVSDRLPNTSIFPSIDEAAGFFALGATGYSATNDPGRFHGMELRCLEWNIVPLAIEEARSAFYDDTTMFPAGSIELDSALVMREIAHEWHSRADLHDLVAAHDPARGYAGRVL